jgi:hypothetical protein
MLIRIIDVETKRPIENVDVFVQETGSVGVTAKFGLSKFSNVPIGKIIIELNKEGYIYKKQEINITNSDHENVITLELTKAKANHINIWGVVRNSGKSLTNMEVSARSLRFIRKVSTDKYGYYNFLIPKDSISATLVLDVKNINYSEEERRVQILQNEIEKEINFDLKVSSPGLTYKVPESEKLPESMVLNSHNQCMGLYAFINKTESPLTLYKISIPSYYLVEPNLNIPPDGVGISPRISVWPSRSDISSTNRKPCYEETTDAKFYFRMVENGVEKYSIATAMVEAGKKIYMIVSKENVSFSSEKPY